MTEVELRQRPGGILMDWRAEEELQACGIEVEKRARQTGAKPSGSEVNCRVGGKEEPSEAKV